MKKANWNYLDNVSSEGKREALIFAIKTIGWSCATIFSAYKAMQSQRTFGWLQLATIIESVFGKEEIIKIAEGIKEL